jgi:DNA-binding Lrp family transcriptional regulator
MLEPRDRRILAELQRDSRLTNQELADKVGMSSSATWRRVKSLEDEGVIERYTAIVSAKKAGFGLESMVHISLARHEQSNVEQSRLTIDSWITSSSSCPVCRKYDPTLS